MHEDDDGGSMPNVATSKPQTISYPATDARPQRNDELAVDPHVVVLFGATGDLARRKLIPGLAYLDQSELTPNIEIVATSLEDISRDDFLDLAKAAIDDFGTHKVSKEQWTRFAETVTYVPQSEGPEALAAAVEAAEKKLGPDVRRLHYLSVPPKAARAVITMLRDAKLVERSRVVMEKPFGTDLASAVELNDFVHETFDESQIFRIDHFLGKEAAQNILAFRFANGLFEPIWNRNFIDHIQIDIPETLGLDERANFYESTGAYKDMVVTHLFQVMAFVVMEPPTALEPRAISEEKNKVFRSMLPVDSGQGGARSVRRVPRRTKAWQGIPTPRRSSPSRSASTTGAGRACRSICARARQMAEGMRIISIAFKEAPRSMFPAGSGVGSQGPDHLTFDLADNSKVSLSFYGKRPGPGMKLDKLSMQFSTQEIDTVNDVLEAYERLILDAMRGDHTLFTTAEGIESLWERSEELLADPPPAKIYQPGTWGPNAIHQLIAPNAWRLPFERAWREAKNHDEPTDEEAP